MLRTFVTVSTDEWTGIQDKPGSLGRALAALAEKGIEVQAFTLGPTGLRLLAADPRAAAAALRAAGLKTEVVEFLEVDGHTAPLAQLTAELGKARINIQAAFFTGKHAYLRVDDTVRAKRVLERGTVPNALVPPVQAR